MRIVLITTLIVATALPAHAQFTLGVGAGTGTGGRGGDAKGTHAAAFLEFKAPALPGLRADAIVVDAPSGTGKMSIALSGVMSAPIPLITPYVLAGWGTYGIGNDSARGGWNIGAGVRARLRIGLYAEYRRHQRIARDLLTVGIVF